MGRASGGAAEACAAIGPVRPERERLQGDCLRRALRDHGLCAINAHWDAGPTFYGDRYSSRIDYLCMSSSAFGRITSCNTLLKEGQRMQLIGRRQNRDRVPLE
eukprot:3777065-Lingulodinium_polyedra.AAC.1